jgi:high-affinity Fe2+/Pb2+ permease
MEISMKYNRTKITAVLLGLVVLYLLVKYFFLERVLHLGGTLLMVINIVFLVIALYIAQAVSKEGPKDGNEDKQ